MAEIDSETWDNIKQLEGYVDDIKTFFENPLGAIIGGALTVLTWVAYQATSFVVETLLFVFGGSQPFASPPDEAQIGLADIPVFIMRILLSPFNGVGTAVQQAIEEATAAISNIAAQSGILAPIVYTGLWGIIAFVAVTVGVRLVRAGLGLLPGGSALRELSGGRS